MRIFILIVVAFWTLPLSAQELNVKNLAPAWNLPWEEDWVTAVAFVGPNRLVAGNEQGVLLVYQLPDKVSADLPKPVRKLEGHTNGITKLLATPDGKKLISASKDKSIRVWNLSAPSTGKTEVILDHKKRDIVAKKNTSKPPTIMPPVAVETQAAEKTWTEHTDWILGLSLSADGKTLLSGDDGGNLLVRDLASGQVKNRWKVKGWVHGLALSPSGELAIVTEQIPLVFDSGRYNAFKIWDTAKGELVKDQSPLVKENLSSAAFSPDGKFYAVAKAGESSDAKIHLFEATGHKKLREMPGHPGGAHDLAFSADSKLLLSCGRDTTLRIWNVADGKQVSELSKARGGQFKDILHALAVSPDQRFIAAADQAGLVQVWHAAAK